ncbi:class I SAM-dependent methyltransferase [Asaia siamensis]
MSSYPEASDLYEKFRHCSDEAWLHILVASLQLPEIEGVRMPAFPDPSFQSEIHGHSGEVSLHEASMFFREIKAYCRYVGRPLSAETRVLDFGCGWGRILRLFMKDIRPENLFGIDSTSRFLMEARRCNPALCFLDTRLAPPTLISAGTFDLIVSFSVFSHLDEFIAGLWINEFHRLLRPGGLAIITTQSRRFIAFCAEQRLRRASGIRLEHGWHEACADSFTDEARANARYDAGRFLHASSVRRPHPGAHYGEAIIPRAYIVQKWGHLFRVIEFLDDPTRVPQVFIVLQKVA